MSVCLFVSNKRQNGWTDRAQIFFLTSRDHRGGLWMIKISNICLHQNSIVIKFFKILKIREIFCENPLIIFILFYDVHRENMFRTNLEDGREAPSKASRYILCLGVWVFVYLTVWRQNGWTESTKRSSPKILDFRNILWIHETKLSICKKNIFVLSKRKVWKIDHALIA